MNGLFQKHDVAVWAISKDTAELATQHRQADGLQFVRLLADPKLQVIRAYGLQHDKALQFRTWRVLGLALGFPSGKKTMAIPTSILIDEHGIVLWIDQAEDYRMRGDEDRVARALRSAFKSA